MSPGDDFGLVVIDPAAVGAIEVAARAAHPYEAGGFLLGYRRDRGVLVVDAIELVDVRSTRTSYETNGAQIQTALNEIIRTRPNGIGYVGPWHSHSALVKHSPDDRKALRRIARQYTDPIVSLVAMRTVEHYDLDALVAQRRRRIRAGTLTRCTVPEFPTTELPTPEAQ